MKVRARLTGRTLRLPRSMGVLRGWGLHPWFRGPAEYNPARPADADRGRSWRLGVHGWAAPFSRFVAMPFGVSCRAEACTQYNKTTVSAAFRSLATPAQAQSSPSHAPAGMNLLRRHLEGS